MRMLALAGAASTAPNRASNKDAASQRRAAAWRAEIFTETHSDTRRCSEPTLKIRNLWFRFGSNFRERGGRNSERIRAVHSLTSPSLPLPLAGRGRSGGTRESDITEETPSPNERARIRGDRPKAGAPRYRSGAAGVDYAIRPSFSRGLRPFG